MRIVKPAFFVVIVLALIATSVPIPLEASGCSPQNECIEHIVDSDVGFGGTGGDCYLRTIYRTYHNPFRTEVEVVVICA